VSPAQPVTSTTRWKHAWFTALLGALLGLCLIKFGNPIILDRHLQTPASGLELLFGSWPVAWAFALASIVILLAPLVIITGAGSRTKLPGHSSNYLGHYILFVPLLWYGWQWVSALNTIDPALSKITVFHFTFCVAFFYVGWFCLPRVKDHFHLYFGILCGFCIMLWVGFDQRFGGLEATREMLYAKPGWEEYPPEFLARIASNRIFGTMFYPNALAGAILLLFPPLFGYLNERLVARSNIARGTIIGLFCYGSAACLFWSESRAGWLVAAALLVIALLQIRAAPRVRWGLAAVLLFAALAVFSVRFTDYFQRGAASAFARMDYWNAAWSTTLDNPILGTGPGTFQIPYARIKAPESEMSRLTHNDYLQQASDSGLPAMVIYTLLVLGSIVALYPKVRSNRAQFLVWLGLVGYALHSFVEFGLYIPAIAWPAFTLLGWLWAWRPGLDFSDQELAGNRVAARAGVRPNG
jgi:hypothetical protein